MRHARVCVWSSQPCVVRALIHFTFIYIIIGHLWTRTCTSRRSQVLSTQTFLTGRYLSELWYAYIIKLIIPLLLYTNFLSSADRPVGGGELWRRGQDLHPVEGVPVARHRQQGSPLRVQQREGGRQGVPSHRVGDEEATHERRLKYFYCGYGMVLAFVQYG
jgi:hypothetical protein